MTNVEAIRKQVEYYLSDSNLENDEFFHNKIREAKEGYIDVDVLLNCNKIKKLGIKSVDHLVEAIKSSPLLELHSSGKLFRRASNKDLPALKKKTKTETSTPLPSATKVEEHAKPEEQNPYKNVIPVFFSLSSSEEAAINFKYIQEGLVRAFKVHPVYVRFNKNEGNFALNKKQVTEELVKKMAEEGLKVGETQLKIAKTEGKALEEFNEKHNFHYRSCLERQARDFEQRLKEERRNRKRNAAEEFEFAGEKYNDIGKLKSLFKNILSRSPNNVPLKENEQKLVLELLSHHERGAEKIKDLKHIVADKHPEHNDTRCFFVVKNDGTREDFSAVKCISNIEEKAKKHQ